MKRIKSFGAFCLSLILLANLGITTLAADNPSSAATTPNYTLQETAIQESPSLSDSVKLEQLTRLFFEAKQENFLSESKNIDLATFYTTTRSKNSIDADNSSKLFKFEKAVRWNSKHERILEEFAVTISDIAITGNSAKVTAYEFLEYVLADHKDIVSSRGTTYFINYTKDGDNWKIERITTDNELEQLVSGYSDVDTLISLTCTDNWTPVASPELDVAHRAALSENIVSRSAQYTRRNYSGVTAINYALEYSSSGTGNSSSGYNPDFPSFSPYDCQNFVSQCIWAGLGGTEVALEEPMISETSSRNWYCYKSPSGSAVNTTTWTSIGSFTPYVANGGSTKPGLYGAVGETGAIANCYAGDALQICNSATAEDYYHTYLIVRATYTNGVRTNDDLWVCAHTTNRNNELLSEIVGNSQSKLRAVAISGSYW